MWLKLFSSTDRWALYILITDCFLYLMLPLEIYDHDSKQFVYPLIWLSFFITIAIATIKARSYFLLAFATLIFIVSSCFFYFTFFLFCRWGNHGDVFVSKENDSVKLICKTYDCYGTDEDCRLYKKRILFEHVSWVTSYPDKNVDTTVWRGVH